MKSKTKICLVTAGAAALLVCSGCAVVDKFADYDWSSWWSTHQKPVTELIQDALAAPSGQTDSTQTKE